MSHAVFSTLEGVSFLNIYPILPTNSKDIFLRKTLLHIFEKVLMLFYECSKQNHADVHCFKLIAVQFSLKNEKKYKKVSLKKGLKKVLSRHFELEY